MNPTRATLTLALGTALALYGLPADAQRSRGGGMRHGGGGHHGGGYAVPRGGPGYRPPSGAAGRHPQPGYGYRGGYHGGYRGGYYGGYRGGYYGGYHGHGRYGYYRPYYGYGYYPYPYYGYRPYGFSFSFGWPYYYGGYWPYAAPVYAPTDSVVAPYAYTSPGGSGDAPPASSTERGRYEADRDVGRVSDSNETGRLRLEVKPDDAAVYVDDEFWAEAREARMLWLRAGVHTVEVVRPGFPTERREVEVVKGATKVLRLELGPSQ